MPVDRRELLAVFAGGALGTLARAEIAVALPPEPGHWPWATFLVNIAGALMLGLFTTLLIERRPPSFYRRPFWGTGVCGGLTTFSTLQLEVLHMLDDGEVGLALLYVSLSVTLGFLAVALATNVVRSRA